MRSPLSSSLRKITLSLGLVLVSAVYVAWLRTNGSSETLSSQKMISLPSIIQTFLRHRLYTDGSYIGTAADAYYGIVQVKAIVRDGQLIDVQFLQYPNERDNSRLISKRAIPLLTQEAIQAQNAEVDGVSGATQTSAAFKESLASALILAKNK